MYYYSIFLLTGEHSGPGRLSVHEDNLGALKLAKLELGRHTPRSKFYGLKLHWFRSWLKPNAFHNIEQINIVHCSTEDQKANILTKALVPAKFKSCRKLTMGW